MKVNFNIPILTYRGDNLKDPNGNNIPLKDSICRILSAITMGTDEDKMMVAGLIEKMWAESGEMDITEQEADVIKANIKGLPVVLFAQVYKMLTT
jgi:hypothetical protein